MGTSVLLADYVKLGGPTPIDGLFCVVVGVVICVGMICVAFVLRK